MKFVALLSGGKDSCYNVIKCQQYGHELVCLANLCPPSSFNGEEMNSFMYQSAAHAIIPLMEECFGVPLLRREIIGSAVRQELDYVVSEHDEVEDLYNLLVDVKSRFPDVTGVSCGAIVSTYQRFRVESVCSRLGMTPLTYLWQRDRAELLNEMVDTGLQAVLVKVAGAGLEPYKHLGKTLAELRPTLFRLNAKFGLDVCGEGGEFESLVLDCSVFKKKIVIETSEVVLDEEDCMVGNLKIVSARCVEKEVMANSSAPDLFREMCDVVAQLDDGCSEQSHSSPPSASAAVLKYTTLPAVMMSSSGLGQTAPVTATPSSTPLTPSIVQSQLQQIFQSLRSALLRVGVSLADILFVHLYIADISLFGPVNEEYCKWFGQYPPSRSCIAVPLSVGVGVALDAVFLKSSHTAMCKGVPIRQVLHVQSMSEWAPLSIGPYSQANTALDCLIFTAGQIALNPSTMTMLQASPSGSLRDLLFAQLVLACRHVSRVLETLNSSLHRVMCCTVFVNMSVLARECGWSDWQKVESVVQKLIENNFEPKSSEDDCDGSDVESVDSAVVVPDRRVPILVVGVPGLPRDALVEVEMVSFKDNAIPVSLFGYQEKQQGTLSTAMNAELSTAQRVQSWPFWKCNSPFDETESQSALVSAASPSYQVESRVMSLRRNLCMGFLNVSVAGGSDSSLSVELDLDQVVLQLVQGLAALSTECDLSLDHSLLTLRVYYVPGVDATELTALLMKNLAVICGVVKRLPVLTIPVTCLKPGCVVAAQVIAVDAHQMQSELWIHNK